MSDIDEVFDLYLKYGNKNYIGENISQLEHGYQAAILAEKENCSKEFIVGAFLHDIGHLLEFDNPHIQTMNNLGVMNHEKVGADYLRSKGFSELSCSIVENHVKTKRYLISKNTDYYNKLSDASKQTFEFQGGKLTEAEIKQYEQNKYFQENLKMRKYDDLAKDISIKIPKENIHKTINYYKNIAKKIIN
jgi:predicted HD phosphohydrolase